MIITGEQSKFGKYLIHEELGRGGFGTVYRAIDTTLQRTVALKILDADKLSDPDFLERFRREARAAGGLAHPNVVSIYEIGEVEGRWFIAMQYVTGASLDRLLVQAGRLPRARALHILTQAAAALDFAHAQGVVHRDVKPGNILVGQDAASEDADHAVLTDFGLARAGERSVLTSLGQTIGTPAYMAPEQLDVDRQSEVGPASDIYALAMVAYELLAGRPAFVGPTPAVMMAHLTKEPPPVTQFDADLPSRAWTALAPALSKNPADRPASATALVQALATSLQPAATAEPTIAPVPPSPPAVGPPVRRPVFPLAIIGMLLVLASLLTGYVLRRPPPGPVVVQTVLATTTLGPTQTPRQVTVVVTSEPAPTTPPLVVTQMVTTVVTQTVAVKQTVVVYEVVTATPTPPQLPSLTRANRLKYDDFSSPSSGWDVFTIADEGVVGYEAGKYFVEARNNYYVSGLWADAGKYDTNFALRVKMYGPFSPGGASAQSIVFAL